METTPRNQLPYIMPQQAQKHVTHNEAIRILDSIVQIAVSGVVNDPSSLTPEEGMCVLVGEDGTDVFEGKANHLASFVDGAWMLHQPVNGWLAYRTDIDILVVFSEAGWIAVAGVPDELQNIDRVGINASADDINRLSINSPASLFNHAGAGHQLKVNKASAEETASLLFQTGFQGRAEMGTTGSDDFVVKIADDTGTWRDAISVNGNDGQVTFPNGVASPTLHGRPDNIAGTDKIYIDAVNGSDANSGLSPQAAIQSFAALGTRLSVGRKLELRLLSDIVVDHRIDITYVMPNLNIRGRTENDLSGIHRTIFVADALNRTVHPGGFVFQSYASVYFNRVNIELTTSRGASFLEFSNSMGYIRTRKMSLTKTGTGSCCLFGSSDTFVPNSHAEFAVSAEAKANVALGVAANMNPNDDWRYPSNLTQF